MKTIVLRGALCLAALLVVVPLAVWTAAEAAEDAFGTSHPLLTRNFFQNNWILQDASGKIINKDPKSGFYWVVRNAQFTMSWDAKAPVVGDGTDPIKDRPLSGEGVFCSKSWEGSYRAQGTATGRLSANRTFHMTCSGLGGGVIGSRVVKVGWVDLAVQTVALTGLTRKEGQSDTYIAGDAKVVATIKNSGTVAAPEFKVGYYMSLDSRVPKTDPSTLDLFPATVDSLAVGAKKTVESGQQVLTASNMPYWFKACVDDANVIPETDQTGASAEANNCKILGPIKIVAQ